MFKDYYLILQVHFLASEDIIKAAYKRLAQIHHPDRGGSLSKFHDIQEAYEHLMDKSLKQAYTKEWMKFYIHEHGFTFNELKPSLYDISMHHVKEVLTRYLNYIKDERFHDAYRLLSGHNKSKIFEKDFIVWQKLIAEIHHLLDFDCSFESYDRSTQLVVVYRVKVREYNKLMHHVEEDFFKRHMIYENNRWCIMLSDIDVRTVIRKYKKIMAHNRKNIKKYLPKIDENHVTKHVSSKYFINNCEYERLRYLRYQNPFTIVSLSAEKDMIEVLNSETRALDCYCELDGHFLLLLPETSSAKAQHVIDKIQKFYKTTLQARLVEVHEDISIKEMIKSV